MKTNALTRPRSLAHALHSSRLWRLVLVVFALALGGVAGATTVVPVSDASLYRRADVVVHGTVLSTATHERSDGRPETVVVIEPLEVLKGGLSGNLVLHQLGGSLPDGRFFKLWGRPEYEPGHEVIVFAISRPEGEFQTAEMLLGKFEVKRDTAGSLFAISSLRGAAEPEGVSVRRDLRLHSRRNRESALDSTSGPRDLGRFLDFLRNGAAGDERVEGRPDGTLEPVRRFVPERTLTPSWSNLGGLWRYTNNATAAWYLDGSANMTGGGSAEAQRALATWTNEPNSAINYTLGGSNPIHMNALSSPCGWSTALPPELGVIGCGGPNGGSSTNSWRGDVYSTITGGEVWLRAYSSTNQVSSVITESVLLHELGHTLGLGHSDTSSSPHDTCRGDESLATMRSSVQNRTTLGTDDVDAVRWLYGDGGNSCTSPPPCSPPQITSQPQSYSIQQGQTVTLWVGSTGATAYQWYLGGSGDLSLPIAGAVGASLSVAPMSSANYWVRVSNSCGGVNSSTATINVSIASVAGIRGDFNGDGRADLLWRNPQAGDTRIWLMNRTTYIGTAFLPSVPSSWELVGAADFTGDGFTDLVWRNSSTGQTHIWQMRGTTYVASTALPVVPVSWKVKATCDMNGDGSPDIIWRNDSTSETHVWIMNRTAWSGSVRLPSVPSSWQVAVAADFNGDGQGDLLWRNEGSGENHIWIMSGLSRAYSVILPPVTDSSWKPEAVADYDGDGRFDLVWRNYRTGQNTVWRMSSDGRVLASLSLMQVAPDWRIVGPR